VLLVQALRNHDLEHTMHAADVIYLIEFALVMVAGTPHHDNDSSESLFRRYYCQDMRRTHWQSKRVLPFENILIETIHE